MNTGQHLSTVLRRRHARWERFGHEIIQEVKCINELTVLFEFRVDLFSIVLNSTGSQVVESAWNPVSAILIMLIIQAQSVFV